MTTSSPRVTLLLGGVRSGKSARAVALAHEWSTGAGRTSPVIFVATAQPFDDEMTERIAAHKAERPPTWHTLEVAHAVEHHLSEHLLAASATSPRASVVVIDCLTLWVSNLLLELESLGQLVDAERLIGERVRQLLAVVTAHGLRDPHARWIIVSNEVGLGIVPSTALGRHYRDALGRANRLVAEAADQVVLMVAGLELVLKSR